MTDFMTVLGNLTLAASLAVLLVLAVRVLLAWLPKRYLTFLWLPVFFRAVCPVSFQSPFSLYRILNGVPGFHSTGGRMTFILAGYQSARITAVLEAHRKRTERWKGRCGCKCGDGNGGRSRGYIGKYPVWNLAGRRDSGVALRSVFLAAAA